MLSKTEPHDFSPRFESVGCFVEFEGKILLLKRGSDRPEPGTWGMPAGKVEKDELPEEAILRELREETGMAPSKEKVRYFDRFFVKYPEYDFVYHIFHLLLSEAAPIKTDEAEHSDWTWIEPREAVKLPLIGDLDECLKIFYGV
ncbi:MAG: NUDIX hydrolase [Candidatus Taylorbacteria bacterium]|nr:NUDIX hydrolase [Candidatus Taylorbacteria bacterium]